MPNRNIKSQFLPCVFMITRTHWAQKLMKSKKAHSFLRDWLRVETNPLFCISFYCCARPHLQGQPGLPLGHTRILEQVLGSLKLFSQLQFSPRVHRVMQLARLAHTPLAPRKALCLQRRRQQPLHAPPARAVLRAGPGDKGPLPQGRAALYQSSLRIYAQRLWYRSLETNGLETIPSACAAAEKTGLGGAGAVSSICAMPATPCRVHGSPKPSAPCRR